MSNPKSFNNTLITQELIDRAAAYCYQIIDKEAKDEDEQKKLFRNPIWRMGNMYHCIDGDTSKVVKFRPKPAQCVLIYWIYVLGRNRFTILKARQLGFSTLICIIGLDETIFTENTTFNICSHTEDSAKDLLREKVKFNLDKLPRGVQRELNKENTNQNELVFADNWKIRSKVKVRSGTSQVLHVSEWGKVAAMDPIRSKEIRTGTLPTARSKSALVFVESTFEGPAAGDFYDNIQMAMLTTEERASSDSYWYMFFPWYYEESYKTECMVEWIEKRTLTYFEDLTRNLEAANNPYVFSNEQMYFWQCKSYEYGPEMQREMPSTAEEAMTAPVKGAFYADRMIELDRAGRIHDFEWDRDRPVFAVCDVGTDDPFSIWLVQTNGRDIDLIYTYEAKHKPASHFVNLFQELHIPIRRWILPWDAQAKNSNSGWLTDFKQAGAQDVKLLKKYNGSIVMQINYMLVAFPRLRFRKNATPEGRTSVSAYHWEEDTPGQLKKLPKHDWSSHFGSSFGYVGEAEKLGLLRAGNVPEVDYYQETKAQGKKWGLKRC